MKKWIVKTSKLEGRIQIPPSKSHTMRALLFGMLAHGKSVIQNPLPFPDMVRACRLLGAQVKEFSDRIEITGTYGKIEGAEDVIDAGNSGLILRFFAALCAHSPRPIVITGDHSIRHNRPVAPLLQALTQLGAHAESLRGNGLAPILVKGPLQSGRAYLDGVDSQPISALLIASALSRGPTELFVTNPGELPWVGLTLDWFDRLHIPYTTRNGEYYQIPGSARIEPFSYVVPADLSSLAFPVVAALLTHSEITVENLDLNDPQGDKHLLTLLEQMGAQFEKGKETLLVKKSGPLQGKKMDVNRCIDALPALAVISCFAKGETKLVGARNARTKECDRIHALAEELRKMGGKVKEHEDGLRISHSPLIGNVVSSYQDHRMALALTVAGLAAEGETWVEDVACVSKTFPAFKEQMQELGAQIL